MVLDPDAVLVPGDATILVAPDGALCAAPFDALIGPDGRPLLATTAIAVLATGRDAHRMATRANWRTREPVVVAAPDFGEPWEPFGPLMGAITEGSAVADMLGVNPVTAEEATRELVLALDNPEILHLATHGYYLVSGEQPVIGGPGGLPARIAAIGAAHPLISAGIALADANQSTDEEPGVLSALDVLGLPLASTDLVVLSACESGLGPLDAGEGLLGLARSFLLAGARSVVWSLWRIDDVAGSALITDMYRRVLAESDRAHALRGAKRAAYARHPERVDVWAGFALQGDPGPLLRFRHVFVPENQIYADRVTTEENVTIFDTRGKAASFAELDTGGTEPLKIASVSLRNLGLGIAEDELALGSQALAAGRWDEARDHFERGLAQLESLAVGKKTAAMLHGRMALVTAQAGDFGTARQHGLAALELLEALDGVQGPLSVVLDNLGITEFNLGDHDGGLARVERALAIKHSVLRAGDPQISLTERNLVALRQVAGR